MCQWNQKARMLERGARAFSQSICTTVDPACNFFFLLTSDAQFRHIYNRTDIEESAGGKIGLYEKIVHSKEMPAASWKQPDD